MRNILSGVAGLAMAIAIGTDPASAFSGSYSVAIYDGPGHGYEGTVCVTFTQTGNIYGFSDSGTWTTNTLFGPGVYVHDGKQLRWYGVYGIPTAYIGWTFFNKTTKTGSVLPGGYEGWKFDSSTGAITTYYNGTTKVTPGC